MAEAVLRLEGGRKSYNPGTAIEVGVLHGIDLELEAGEARPPLRRNAARKLDQHHGNCCAA